MMKSETPNDVGVVMVSYLPVPGSIGEMKTKPTQTAVRTLNNAGVFADVIIARSPIGIDKKRKEKISKFCNVHVEDVISAPDVDSIYDIPLSFEKDNLSDRLCTMLSLPCSKKVDLSDWKRFVNKTKRTKDEVDIAVIGKYFSSGDFVLSDVYISVLEAIKYSAYQLGLKPNIHYISSIEFEQGKKLADLKQYDGVLVPGGFGKTGIDGKLKVIEYIRKNKIPYFGICYGMQLAVLEYGRNVLKKKDASTEEIDPKAQHLLIGVMPDQKEKIAKKEMGGTMRLGQYPALLEKGSIVQRAYKKREIVERHRHRYEVSPEYIMELEDGGLLFSGKSPDGRLMETMELPEETHPFFVGVQYHPELQARPLAPHPLFTAFVKASYENK